MFPPQRDNENNGTFLCRAQKHFSQAARLKTQVPAAGPGLNYLIKVQTNNEKLLELLRLSKVPPAFL